MKTITGVLVLSALVVPATPAAAQGNLAYQIERIVDYSLTIAADALGDLLDERADRDRDDRQDRRRDQPPQPPQPPRPPVGRRDDRGPEFTEIFTKTVRLGRTGRLELDNVSGDIDVTGVAGDEVKITATKRVHASDESAGRRALNAIEIQVADRAGVVSISAGPTRGRFSSGEIDYIIAVPTGTSLSLKTVSGDVSIRNVSGDLVVNSFSGDVVVGDARPRAIEIELVSGDVSLEKVDSERVHVKSVSGDVMFAGKLARTGRYDISSHSGDIQMIPEGNSGFDLDAATFNGDVSSDFPLRLGGTSRNNLNPGARGSRRTNNIRGTVNDGGAILILHTFNGDILINKR